MSSESTIASMGDEPDPVHYREVIFPAGNSDFRAARNRCAQACREFNRTPDDADPEERSRKWLDIVRPDRDRTGDGGLAVTHDQTFANPALKAKTPFVKPPINIDYGVRLHVGGSTFINRNCMIMDTPVADIVIGEGCNIGPNCCIIGVTHPVRLDERLQRNSIGQPVTIGDDVWIGSNVTILGNVTIGSGAVISACSLVTRDVPPMSLVRGSPARVVKMLRDIPPYVPGAAPVTESMTEALGLRNRRPFGLDLGLDGLEGVGGRCGREMGRGGERGTCFAERETGDLITLDGEEEPSDDGETNDADHENEARLGLGLDIGRRRTFSGGSSSLSSGSTSRGLLAHRRGGEREMPGEAHSLLHEGRRHRRPNRSIRRLEVEVIAVMTVAIALLMVFFFAGVYLGPRRISFHGSG
ncbi:trimeric LpxA-like protein [Staphylotrichum tortipilum]|uniref:Trimeric LpxA-like protein n=1 Tax=Staphylotrichum tortipilum TaxID=2831512 RepID=A0AAN6RUR0_9PEZI|nr:trimeric LpxA-like protein [Staphylotrichum longicolle]